MLDCIDGQMQSIVLPTVLVSVKVNVKHKWNDTSTHQPGLRGTDTPTHCRKLGVVLLQPQQCPGLPVWRPMLVFTYLATSLLGQGLCCFQSASQFSRPVVSDSLQPHESQHARTLCPSPTPGVYSNSYPSSQWCHPAISSSVVPSSSCPQSFPASGSFPMSQLFASGGQSTGVSASASVLPMNTQDWSPSGWTGWISLQAKGLQRVFSNTTVQKHQFFGAQLSSQSNSHIHTWLLEKT